MSGDALTPAKTWYDPEYNPAGWIAEARKRLTPPADDEDREEDET